MTGIQDAIATLRRAIGNNPIIDDALARVEDEIARLNEALTLKATYVANAIDRAEAAEQDRDAARATVEQREVGYRQQLERAEAAEAENARLRDGLRRCPICTHEWHRHDPEDGKCDAGSGDLGECPCGRDDAYHRVRNAALSKAALLAEEGAAQPVSYDELRGYVYGGAMRSKSPAPGQGGAAQQVKADPKQFGESNRLLGGGAS